MLLVSGNFKLFPIFVIGLAYKLTLFVVDYRKSELLDSFNSLRILDRRISINKSALNVLC